MTAIESRRVLRSLAWICHVVVIAACMAWMLASLPLQIWPGTLLVLLIVPLLLAITGLYRDRPYTYQWLSLVLIILIGIASAEVVASQRASLAAVIVMLAALAELLVSFLLVRSAPPTPPE